MKKFVSGVLVGALIMVSASVYGEDGLEKIEAYLRPGLPIKLDGQKLELKNPPVMVDGSTYLPLRELAGIFGKEVNWNEAEQTVELGKRTGTDSPTATSGPTVTPAPTATPELTTQQPEFKHLPNYSEAYEALDYNGIIYVPALKAAQHLKLEFGYDSESGDYFIKSTNINFKLSSYTSKPGDDIFVMNEIAFIKESLLLDAKIKIN